MLTISPINDLSYYADLAAEDYYTKGGEPPGHWYGTGASILGYSGQVDNTNFKDIFYLSGNSKSQSSRLGYDATVSAPKSYSLLWCRAGKDFRRELDIAEEAAVQEVVRFLEEKVARCRRGHAGLIHEKPEGIITASFPHCTNRSQEPQKHQHILINATCLRSDGTFGKLEGRYFFKYQKAAGAIYRNALGNELQKLGVIIEEDPKDSSFFKISGISEDLCSRFSKRGNLIKSIAAELNINPSSKAGKKITLKTREYKQNIDRSSLFEIWGAELDRLGFRESDADYLKDRTAIEKKPFPLQQIISDITKNKSVLHLADIYEYLANTGVYLHQSATDIESCIVEMISQGQIVELENNGKFKHCFTTMEMINIENQLFKEVVKLNSSSKFQVNKSLIENAISEQELIQGFQLSEEQVESVHSACEMDFSIIQGSAGAGKSTSMATVNKIYKKLGCNVIGACTSRQAANNLEEETKIESRTIAKLLIDIENNHIDLKDTVFIIDEAGQIGSKELAKLTTLATEFNAKIIMVGEDKQMQAISNPGALGYLASTLGDTKIKSIRRQREDSDRVIVMQLRDGKTFDALNSLQSNNQLNWCNNSEETANKLVSKWHRYQQLNSKKSSLIIASTWKEVQQISLKVRELMKADGLVGNEDIEFECSVSNSVRSFVFSKGDRIKLCKNDYRRNLTNGTLGTIESISKKNNDEYTFGIMTDDNRLIFIDSDQYCNDEGKPYIALAYALTVYSSQGTTVDGDTFILHNPQQMNRSSTYVACSRHKDKSHIFINSQAIESEVFLKENELLTQNKRLEKLSEMMAREDHPQTTLDYFHEQNLDYLREINSRDQELTQLREFESTCSR